MSHTGLCRYFTVNLKYPSHHSLFFMVLTTCLSRPEKEEWSSLSNLVGACRRFSELSPWDAHPLPYWTTQQVVKLTAHWRTACSNLRSASYAERTSRSFFQQNASTWQQPAGEENWPMQLKHAALSSAFSCRSRCYGNSLYTQWDVHRNTAPNKIADVCRDSCPDSLVRRERHWRKREKHHLVEIFK